MRSRLVILGVSSLLALFCAGCSHDSDNAAPLSETADVLHQEGLVGAYAQTHGAGVGLVAGCAARIIGESNAEDSSHVVYTELMCSSLLGHPACPTTGSSAFVTSAVANFSAAGQVTGLTVDQEDGAASHQWVAIHFPSRWQHVEKYGPIYGPVLQGRLQRQYPCAEAVSPLPGSTASS